MLQYYCNNQIMIYLENAMKRFISVFLAAIITAACLLSFSGCQDGNTDETATAERIIYVSPDGSDESGDGSQTAPFASMDMARQAVREMKKSGGDIVVEFADGFYQLSDTVVFDENDSGNVRPAEKAGAGTEKY